MLEAIETAWQAYNGAAVGTAAERKASKRIDRAVNDFLRTKPATPQAALAQLVFSIWRHTEPDRRTTALLRQMVESAGFSDADMAAFSHYV